MIPLRSHGPHRGTRSKIVVFSTALVALFAATGACRSLHAQVAVFPGQNLSFGTLRAGSPEYVDCGDARRRAELELVGSGKVVLTFTLPTEMVSAGGHRLPLSFGSGDARFDLHDGNKDQAFDPTRPTEFKIKPKDGGATIHLGGMALPDASQPPGRYTATILLQVVTPGT